MDKQTKVIIWHKVFLFLVMPALLCCLIGDVKMDIFEKLLNLLGIPSELVTIIIIAVFVLVFFFIDIRKTAKNGETGEKTKELATYTKEKVDHIDVATSRISPLVENIDSSIKTIAPSITRIEDRSSKIDSISSAVESFKYLKDSAAGNSMRPEELLAYMSNVFEKKADLEAAHKKDRAQIATLTAESKKKDLEIAHLRDKVKKLEYKLQIEESKNNRGRDIPDPDRDYQPEY